MPIALADGARAIVACKAGTGCHTGVIKTGGRPISGIMAILAKIAGWQMGTRFTQCRSVVGGTIMAAETSALRLRMVKGFSSGLPEGGVCVTGSAVIRRLEVCWRLGGSRRMVAVMAGYASSASDRRIIMVEPVGRP